MSNNKSDKIPCEVCGTMFFPCYTCLYDNTAFHYRTHCCSLDCAKIYLRRWDKGVSVNSQKEEDEYDKAHNINKID